MSARINKGRVQFNSRPRLKKQVFHRGLWKPTLQPMVKFSQLIFAGESSLEPKLKQISKTEFDFTFS